MLKLRWKQATCTHGAVFDTPRTVHHGSHSTTSCQSPVSRYAHWPSPASYVGCARCVPRCQPHYPRDGFAVAVLGLCRWDLRMLQAAGAHPEIAEVVTARTGVELAPVAVVGVGEVGVGEVAGHALQLGPWTFQG